MDRDLQLAILASLSSAFQTPPPVRSVAPAPMHGGVGGGSYYSSGGGGGVGFRGGDPWGGAADWSPAARSGASASAARSGGYATARRSGGTGGTGGSGSSRGHGSPAIPTTVHGRRDQLAREGIVPTSSGSSPAAGAKKGRTGAASAAGGWRVDSVGRRVRDLGGGWLEHSEAGTFERCGMHVVVEGGSPRWYVATFEPSMGARAGGKGADTLLFADNLAVNVEISLKTTKPTDAAAADNASPLKFTLILGYKSAEEFLALTADVREQTWTLYAPPDATPLASVSDAGLRPDFFYNIVCCFRGDTLSVDVNGNSLLSRVRLPAGALQGAIGVGAQRSKMVFKGLRILPAATGAASGGSNSGGGSSSRHISPSPLRSLAAPAAAGAAMVASGGSSAHGQPVTAAAGAPRGRPKYVGDDPEIVAMIEREILDSAPRVSFNDIAALDDAKRLLNEAVVLPLLIPEFFTGIREPWKGVLLYGPPGTGKTMLAKAVANMNDTTFFNCSAALLVSKWRGEGEKIVRCLFNMARHYAPSIIFFDELDALAGARGSDTEHEASRRLKTQLLSQMDGVTTAKASEALVMVLATSNTPWDLDEALRRRLEKRIYIPLPDTAARKQMFQLNFGNIPTLPDLDLDECAERTDGFSGADIHILCRDASMRGMRMLLAGKTPQDIQRMRSEGALVSPPVSMADVLDALEHTRPSVSARDLQRYTKWEAEHGST